MRTAGELQPNERVILNGVRPGFRNSLIEAATRSQTNIWSLKGKIVHRIPDDGAGEPYYRVSLENPIWHRSPEGIVKRYREIRESGGNIRLR